METKNEKSFRNHFLVFEGIDGAGTETQSKLLFKELKKRGFKTVRLSYPDKNNVIGKVIYNYLDGKHNFDLNVQFLLYFSDFIKDQLYIKNCLKNKVFIVADRYFTSTLAYQVAKGFSLQKAIEISKIFNLISPDIIFFLKITPEISMERKRKEKGSLDLYERDLSLLSKTLSCYDYLCKNNIFSKWRVIDGSKPIEEVFKEVKGILNL
jgi:dTMP kinase